MLLSIEAGIHCAKVVVVAIIAVTTAVVLTDKHGRLAESIVMICRLMIDGTSCLAA